MVKISGITKSEVLVGLLVAVSVGTGIVALVLFDITGEKGSGLDKEFVYDIEDKIKIDPNLIFYTESSVPIVTGFKTSRGIAVDTSGTIFTAGDKSVRLFDSSGNLQGEIRLDSSPRCITVSKDGKIYIGCLLYTSPSPRD